MYFKDLAVLQWFCHSSLSPAWPRLFFSLIEELQYIIHRPQMKYRSRTVAVITLRAQYCRPEALPREALSIAGVLMLFEAVLIMFHPP